MNSEDDKTFWVVKTILLCFVLITSISLLSSEAMAEKRIGILSFSEETRYQDAANGFIAALRESGFKEPKTKFIIENAGANKAKAAELVQKFAASKMDLIFTLGTSATIATVREIKTTPIVFAVVYDPVDAGISKGWKSSGNNTTGTSTKLRVSKLIDLLAEFQTVQRLAVLYNPGEKNSVSVLKDILKVQPKYAFRIVPVPLTKQEDIAEILPAVIHTSDAIYITGSNLVDREISTITDMATKAGVVTISHLQDMVDKGVLLGTYANYYADGHLAGEKAIKILRGARPSAIPIEPVREFGVVLNLKTLSAGRFNVPQKVMERVSKKIE